MDLTFLHGYGFPRPRRGPLKYADIRVFAKDDPLFRQPSPLIVDRVARGAALASLDRSA